MDVRRTQDMVLCALFAALTAAAAQLTLPVGPVPVNLALLPVLASAMLLPPRMAALASAVYLGMGLCGMPVFSGLIGGAGHLAGPSGGYVVGYVPCAWVTARLMPAGQGSLLRRAAAAAAGLALCHAVGLAWFLQVTRMEARQALAVTLLPCLAPDAAKAFLAAWIAPRVKKAIRARFP